MFKNPNCLKIVSWSFFIILIILIFKMFAQPYRISGDCMEPAVKDGGWYFVNRMAPYFRQYKIGDIVVFKHEDKNWFARIVALENDTIKISEQNIIINNISLHDAVSRNWTNWKYGVYAVDTFMKIPLGDVYVLSDDLAAHHDDSRVFGPISKSLIVGVLW